MIHRTLVVAGILAVLAGSLPHAGDSCAMEMGDHECCAPKRVEETADTCCAPPTHEVAHGLACGCDHHREVVVLAAVGVPGPDLTQGVAHAAPNDRADVVVAAALARARTGDPLRAHPPPAFLLDCTFLT